MISRIEYVVVIVLATWKLIDIYEWSKEQRRQARAKRDQVREMRRES